VLGFIGHSPKPSRINQDSAVRRRQAQRDLLASMRGPGAALRVAIFRFLFKYNEIYVGLRDNHRFYYDQIWWLLRRTFVVKGERLHAAGLLDAADDIFFLNRAEQAELRSGLLPPAVARERIAVRRREWQQTKRQAPPRFLRRGYAPDEADSCGAKSGLLTGIAASPGQARGAARVVRDVAELGRVQRGDVLVARQTDPSWTPAFARAGGLILETGSVLAHGASLCREFGLPCVTGVERASEYISDGDLVELSGSSGTVHILGSAEQGAAAQGS
jgi:pyruvate,water dikinase